MKWPTLFAFFLLRLSVSLKLKASANISQRPDTFPSRHSRLFFLFHALCSSQAQVTQHAGDFSRRRSCPLRNRRCPGSPRVHFQWGRDGAGERAGASLGFSVDFPSCSGNGARRTKGASAGGGGTDGRGARSSRRSISLSLSSARSLMMLGEKEGRRRGRGGKEPVDANNWARAR